MNLTECSGGVAPHHGLSWQRTQLWGNISSAQHLQSQKKPLAVSSVPATAGSTFLPIGNCGGCCHISLGTGRVLQAAHLGWACCVLTGSSWLWTHELLLQSSSNVEAETAFPLVIQEWVIPHAAHKTHACSASLFPSLFLMFLESTASTAVVSGEIDA